MYSANNWMPIGMLIYNINVKMTSKLFFQAFRKKKRNPMTNFIFISFLFLFRARMRIPTLENVYQTLEKQHQILMKEKERINKLKIKAGLRDSSPNKIKYSYSNTDNLYVIHRIFIFI